MIFIYERVILSALATIASIDQGSFNEVGGEGGKRGISPVLLLFIFLLYNK